MVILGMSANSRKEPNFDSNPANEDGNIRSFNDLSEYILEEEPGEGFGRVLIRSGFVILFGFAVFAGYQFVQDSRTDRQFANNSNNTHAASENGSIRNIDLTQTGSIKNPSKLVTERPMPITQELNTSGKIHVVQPGDTLSAISRTYKVKSSDIIALNGIDNPRLIKPGMKLKIAR